MATDPAERFKKIFANTGRPELPDPGRPHIADLELANPAPADQEVKRFKIPDVPQVKRKIIQPDRSGARDIISNSEDEDEYVNAFKSSAKPSMLQKPKKIGNSKSLKPTIKLNDTPEDNISPSMRCPEDDVDKIQSPPELPVQDVDGNKATAHFCIFSLVAKFPYKYMQDPSDKVSKRFFASNKFYEREWDM